MRSCSFKMSSSAAPCFPCLHYSRSLTSANIWPVELKWPIAMTWSHGYFCTEVQCQPIFWSPICHPLSLESLSYCNKVHHYNAKCWEFQPRHIGEAAILMLVSQMTGFMHPCKTATPVGLANAAAQLLIFPAGLDVTGLHAVEALSCLLGPGLISTSRVPRNWALHHILGPKLAASPFFT